MSDNVPLGSRRLVESFRYPAVQASAMLPAEVLGLGAAAYTARDRALQQEIAAAAEAARKQAFQQGIAQANAAAAKAIEQERLALCQTLTDFATQRKDYFRSIESQAVRLALSIARKILHREAQIDPLLLAGVVRVALEGVQRGSKLVLHTSPDAVRSWAEFCANNLPGDRTVDVVADQSLKSHQCILEAEVGSTEIGLDSQLQEIESGFFDLLQEKIGRSHE